MRIGEDARRCVVFFGVPGAYEKIEYGGTGFLIAYEDDDEWFTHLVTAGHVAKSLEKYQDTGFFIRANKKHGGSKLFPLLSIPWHYHPDPTVDLAITPISLDSREIDHIYIKFQELVIDHRDDNAVMYGDPINIVGLFRLHTGSQRNVPIVHSGHVAALPDPQERVPIRDRVSNEIINSEVYLVEAHTLGGISGSPVFMHETVNLSFTNPLVDGHYPKAYGVAKLLGIYVGSWDGEPGAILAKDRTQRGNVRVPVGVGAVVPAPKIAEVLEVAELKNMRQMEAHRRKSAMAVSQDSALLGPPTKDENP